MNKPGELPWQNILEAAVGYLQLLPNDFWGMTPTEFSLKVRGWKKLHGLNNPVAITREELNTMISLFPDYV